MRRVVIDVSISRILRLRSCEEVSKGLLSDILEEGRLLILVFLDSIGYMKLQIILQNNNLGSNIFFLS